MSLISIVGLSKSYDLSSNYKAVKHLLSKRMLANFSMLEAKIQVGMRVFEGMM